MILHSQNNFFAKAFIRINKLEGAFKVSNYAVIDAFYQGVTTSIKTIDLKAKSYLKGDTVFNTLKGYTNKLANFEGTKFAGVENKRFDKEKK